MSFAKFNGQILAEHRDVPIIDGQKYFPPVCVKMQFFKKNSHTTTDAKGTATWFDIEVQGKKVENAAWMYENPNPSRVYQDHKLRNRMAFDTTKIEVGKSY